MAFIIKDRVKENTITTGTGSIALGGAAATFDTFQSYMTNGDTSYYAIVHTSSGVDEWEVGLGTWNTGNTLTRTTVLAGSNGLSAENFSAGAKDVFMTYPASHAALAGDDVDFANITVTGTVDGRDVAADGTKLDGIDTSADVTDAVTVAAAGALMRAGGTMTGNLILNADPTTALGAATKEYVDTIAAAGIHYHTPVRVEAPLNLTVSYNNGTAGVGATLTNSGTQEAITIDGVALDLADRVLVYEQTDATQNGIYTVTALGSASTNWVLTRATDADAYGVSDPDSFGEGDAFFVKEGATGAGELYVMNTSGTITFGTTAISFTVIAETAVYSAGTGLSLDGTTFSIGQDVGTSSNVTFNQVTAAIIGNVTGDVTGDVTGNADTATALETARTIQLTGDVTGSVSFDGSANASITTVVQDDSHSHVISNVDGLQTALDAKAPTSRTIGSGNGLTGGGNLTANRTLNVGAGSGITVTADAVSHSDTSSQGSSNNSGRTYIQDVTLDTFGHVTGLATATETVTDTTYSAGSGLNLSGTTFSHTDTSSQGSVNNSSGTVIQDITLDTYGHITAIASTNLDGRYYTETEADSRFVDTAGDTMTGDLTFSGGAGAITVSGGSDLRFTTGAWTGEHSGKIQYHSNHFYFQGAGSWFFRNSAGANTISFSNAGSISLNGTVDGRDVGTDGAKLDTIATGANNYSFPYTVSSSAGNSSVVQRSPSGYIFANYLNTTANDVSSGVTKVMVETGNDNYIRHGSAAAIRTFINVENGATADQSASQILTAVKTVDGSGSGLDADLLDGVQGSSYLRSDTSDTFTTLTGTNLNVTGTTTLGNGNNDVTNINDTLKVYATDSGDSHFYFGEDSANGYGSHWYWDSSYTHTWYSRHAGTDSAIMYHDTSDTSYLHLGRHIHAHNKDINYVNQLHFNDNVRFYDDGNDSYLNFKWGDTGSGGIKFRDGNDTVHGYIYGDGGGRFGLLDNDGNWAVHVGIGTEPLQLRCNNNIELYVFDGYVHAPGSFRAPNFYVDSAIYHNGDTNTYMQFHAADQWRVVTGGAERLEVNNSQITSTEPIHAPSFHGDGSSLTGTFVPKAWVNYKNSGGNSLIDSGNVSSVTDVATGVFRPNFSTNWSSATYTVSGASNTNNGNAVPALGFSTSGDNTYTTSAVGIAAEDVDGGYTDYINNTAIFVGNQ